METGTALSRAMIRVMKNCRNKKEIHVINMSYGEMSNFSNTGFVNFILFLLYFYLYEEADTLFMDITEKLKFK